ncbi:hypothetical protein X975_20158, partial [Stegodyphus mimosarum]
MYNINLILNQTGYNDKLLYRQRTNLIMSQHRRTQPFKLVIFVAKRNDAKHLIEMFIRNHFRIKCKLHHIQICMDF